MSTARRRLCHWLLTTFLERGVDPLRAARRHRWLRTHCSRVVSREECAALAGPYAGIHFLPRQRP